MSASDPNQTPTGQPEGQVIKVYDRPEKKAFNPVIIVVVLLVLLVLGIILFSVLRH